ncbi:MAG: rRNA maturation RNase YbeY [Methyloceanibacter sp.]
MADGGPSRNSAARGSGSRLDVAVVRHDEAWRTAGVTDAMLARAARGGFAAAAPSPPGTYEVSILLTDDAEMRALNRTWRGKDAATNVLSFPANDTLAPSEPGLLGDIALAYETTLKEAQAMGIALSDHVAHLVVHGVLHLLGFDHLEEDEAERMETLERRALASLGIADPYAERSETRTTEVSP